MATRTNLGKLIVDLELQMPSMQRSLDNARKQALSLGRELEQSMKGANKLHLAPTVDLKQIHDLNKAFDSKVAHRKRVQQDLDRNPVTPKVDLRNLDQLEKRLAGLKNASVNIAVNSKSIAGQMQQVKVQADIDTAQLARSFDRATEKLGDQVAKQVEKGTRRASKKGLFDQVGAAVTAIPKSIARGTYEGIGFTYSQEVTKGFIKGIEGKFNRTLSSIGEDASKRITAKAQNVGDQLVRKLGLGDSLVPATKRVRKGLEEILPSDVIGQRFKTLESSVSQLANSLIDLESAATQMKNLKAVTADLSNIANIPVEGFDKRRTRKIANSADMVKRRAAEIAQTMGNVDLNAQSINIVSGGFAGSQGKSSQSVANRVRQVVQNGIVDYVDNPDTDTSVNVGKTPRWLSQILARYSKHNIGTGFNKDAIEAAAKALAYQQKGVSAPINFVGYSGGGYVAKEATEILKTMGVESRGVGIGTPMFGLTGRTDPNQFRSYIGANDPLNRLKPMMGSNVRTINAGQAHKLSNYLGSESFQKELSKFLGVGTSGVQAAQIELSDFDQNLETLAKDLTGLLSDPSQKQFAAKTGLYKTYLAQIKQHRTTLSTLMNEAYGDVAEMIQGYDESLSEAERLVKQSFGVAEVTSNPLQATDAQLKRRSTPIKAVPRTAPKPVDLTVLPTIDTERLQKQFKQAYTAALTQLAKSVNLESVRVPEFKQSDMETNVGGSYNAISNKISVRAETFNDIVEKFGLDIQSMSTDELNQAIRDLAILMHETFHSLQSGFSGMSVMQAAQGGKIYAPTLPTSAEDRQRFAQVMRMQPGEGVKRSVADFKNNPGYQKSSVELQRKSLKHTAQLESGAYNFQARFISEMMKQVGDNATSLQDAFTKSLQALESELKTQSAKIKPAAVAQVKQEIKETVESSVETIEQVQAQLNGYTAEILREISRISGRGVTKRKKSEVIDDLLKNLNPAELRSAISAVDPLIERGVRGGMKLSKVEQTPAEKAQIERLREFEQILDRNLSRYHNPDAGATREDVDRFLGKVLDQVTERIAQLDEMSRQILAPETRMAYGQAKGRLEQKYRQYSPDLRNKQAQQVQQTLQQGINNISLARVQQQNAIQIAREAQKTYEAIVKSVAETSKAALSSKNLPQLIVDDSRLKAISAKALYDIKQNAIVIDSEIAKILEQGDKALAQYTDQLKDIVHESRHAAQFGFGARRLSDVARTGQADIGLIAPQNAPRQARYYAAQSIGVAQAQAGGLLPKSARRAIYQTEVDAYAFEQYTPEVLARARQIRSQNQGLGGFARNMASTGAEQIAQLKASSANFGQFTGTLNNIAGLAKEASTAVTQLAGDFIELAAEQVRFLPGGDIISDLITKMGKLGGVIKPLLIGFVGFQVLQPVMAMFSKLGGAAIAAAEDLERLQGRFNFNFAGSGAEQLDAVTNRAVMLRQNINDARENYLQFATAVKDTPLEFTTNAAQEALGKAALTQGLTREQMQRTQTAIIQSAGKGQLYSEEIFGQLAESLPNAPAVLARSRGTDIAGLRAQMKGGLSAEDALPKFFAQLEAESSLGVGPALDTAASKAANLENQITLLNETMGSSLLPVKKIGLDVLAGMAQAATVAIGPLIQLAGAAALVALGPTILKVTTGLIANTAALAANGAAALIWGRSYTGAGVAAGNFAKIMNSPAMKGFGLTTAIFAGIEGLKLIMGYFKDAGGNAREFADQMAESGKKYAEAIGKLNKKPDPLDGETQLEKYFGEGYGKKTMRHFENSLMKNPLGFLSAGIIKETPKFLQFQTYGEKQQKDQERAMQDVLRESGNISADMSSMLQNTAQGMGPLAEMQGIMKQVKSLQTERRLLTPDQSGRRREIDTQLQQLSIQRQDPEQQVRMLSGRGGARIEALTQLRDESTFDPAAYRTYDEALQKALAHQEQFNKQVDQAVVSVEKLAITFQHIAEKAAEAYQAIDMFGATSRMALASQITSGQITSGQADYTRIAIDQEQAAQRIAASQKQIQSTLKALNDDTRLQEIFAQTGFNIASSPADIRLKARTIENDDDRGRLEAAAGEIANIREQELNVANLQAQIEEARAQAAEKLRDLAKSIYEFYRSIEQQAVETQLNTRSLMQQISTTNAQNRLRSALVGFQESFTNDFVESLVSLVETLNKPLNDAISAQQQIVAAQQQYFSQLQQATNLQQQMPTAQQVAALSGGTGGAMPVGGQMPSAPALPMAVANTPAAAQAGRGQVQPGNGLTPEQQAAAYAGFSSMAPNRALQFSGQGLGQATALAQQTYQQQVANIQAQLAMQQRTAEVERQMQMSNASFALTRANREIRQQGTAQTRAVEDLQFQGRPDSLQKQFQQSIMGLERQFQDQMLSANAFQRGLEQTIQQQAMLRDQITSGLLPPEFKEFLPQISETIANARAQLDNLASNTEQYRKAFDAAVKEQERLAAIAERDRRAEVRVRREDIGGQIQEQRIARLRAQGMGDAANDLEVGRQMEGVSQAYQRQIEELQKLVEASRLTTEDFNRLREASGTLRDETLRRIESEESRRQAENRFAAAQQFASLQSNLFSAQAETLRNGDPQAASELMAGSMYGKEATARLMELEGQAVQLGSSFASAYRDLENMRSAGQLNTQEFERMAGVLSQTNSLQQRNLQYQMEQAKRITTRTGSIGGIGENGVQANAADLRRVSERISEINLSSDSQNERMQRLINLISAPGASGVAARYQLRGDPLLAKIGELTQGTLQGSLVAGNLASRIGGGQIDSSAPGLVERLDQLIAVTKQQNGLLARPSLTVNSMDALGSAVGLYGDLSRDAARSAGL